MISRSLRPAAAALAAALIAPAGAAGQSTVRVGLAVDNQASMTPDARYVAFVTGAPGVFVRDCALGRTEDVMHAPGGGAANGISLGAPVLSADGRFVAYAARASNLVAGDTNGVDDVFVFERATATTTRVSVAADGTQPNAASTAPSISADGRYVAFQSAASNLVAGDGNGTTDVFVRDLETGTTARASVGAGANEAQGASSSTPGALSADGRFVAFASTAGNLVAADANGPTSDVFVRDLRSGLTELADRTGAGEQVLTGAGNAFIGADGRRVVFQCFLVCGAVPGNAHATAIFVRDRDSGTVREVSVGPNGEEAGSSVFIGGTSPDARHVAFATNASNLGPVNPSAVYDFYVRDIDTATTERVSVSSAGTPANDSSITVGPTISADGRYVLFTSTATNLVADDTNGQRDVFLRDRGAIAAPPDGTPPAIACDAPDAAWHAGDVAIHCSATDAGSGLADGADASFQLVTASAAGAEGPVATNSRQVCDAAGNCALAGPLFPALVDRKPPLVAFVDRTPKNANGWNDTDVTVRWSCTDGGSGAVAAFVAATVSSEGPGQSATGVCEDRVRQTSANIETGISLDKTLPTVSAPTLAGAILSASAADALSGLDGGEYVIDGGAPVAMALGGSTLSAPLAQSGGSTVCLRSRDRAGNWSTPACAPLAGPGEARGHGWISSSSGGRVRVKVGKRLRVSFEPAGPRLISDGAPAVTVAGTRGVIEGADGEDRMRVTVDGRRIRIQVWQRRALSYDSQPGDPDGADPTTPLARGWIVIRRTRA